MKTLRTCYHVVISINEPAPSGKPYRWQCTKCGKKLKTLSGSIITPETARKLMEGIK